MPGRLDLKTLAGRTHLYGLGPIEQLRGEVTIADSCPALARVGPDGTVNVIVSFDDGVPFFVWAEAPHWVKMPIPEKVRSFEDLETFARNREEPHLAAWRRYNQAIGSDGSVGIWHETYLVKAGQYEAVYGNMPAFGLGAAGRLLPAIGDRATARGRLSAS